MKQSCLYFDIDVYKRQIYAHGRENHTMFGTLKNVLDESWYQNEENYVVKLATQTQSYVYQVFSVYRIENTNDYIQTEFKSDTEYIRFLTKLQERSIAAVSYTHLNLGFCKCLLKSNPCHFSFLKTDIFDRKITLLANV